MSLLHRLTNWLVSKRAFRQAYRKGLKQAQQEYEDRRIELELSNAKILNAAYESAKKNGRDAGYSAGHRAGLEKGTADGCSTAYLEACHQMGLLNPRPVDVAANLESHQFDAETVHANIYRTPVSFVVRLLVGGRLLTRTHDYADVVRARGQDNRRRLIRLAEPSDGNRLRQALVDAIVSRQQLLPVTAQHGHVEIVREIWRDLIGLGDSVDSFTYGNITRVAGEFHRRMMADVQGHAALTAFVGEDPEDRFNLPDKSVMTRPWPEVLPELPASLVNSLGMLGLGGGSTGLPARTLRDVLLLTVQDLRSCYGIGNGYLNNLRYALAALGLALWGETPPERPAAPLEVGERHRRSIDLD